MTMTLLKLGTIAVILALLAGLLGHVHPALDSFSHFRFHLLMILLVMTAFLLMTGSKLLAASAVVIVAISLSQTKSHLPLVGYASATTGGNFIKLMQLNVLFRNTSFQHAANIALDSDADVISFQEITSNTKKILELIKARYPYQHSCAFKAVGSVALASRHRFANVADKLCRRADGFTKAAFQIGDRRITVASIHLHWPWPKGQASQLDRLSDSLSKLDGPVLIAGDFNAAPWSHSVKRVARTSRTQISKGFLPTWSLGQTPKNWVPTIGLQLDNTLYSDHFIQLERILLPDAASDHLPVLTTFGING